MKEKTIENEKTGSGKLVEQLDYYFESGFMVLTAHFLRRRGFCCENGCRHCPFKEEQTERSQ